ncbi:YidB family protein [Psychrobacter sp.]|uniref:YidB family protein n=1 Tax=Psychrobacter sp. TaxID=56811 RepID=UPI003F989088
MSLLGNLVSQVARSAMDPEDAQRNPVNQSSNSRRTGGLGDILGSVLGGQSTKASSGFGGKGMLVAALMPMVLSWIKRNGGLKGALSKITGMGFENQARSWMSNQEDNDNLDPNDVNRLFDEGEIQQVAAHTGANDAEVRQGIAELLPEVMNQLTPNGNLDDEAEANAEVDQIINQLSSRLGALK